MREHDDDLFNIVSKDQVNILVKRKTLMLSSALRDRLAMVSSETPRISTTTDPLGEMKSSNADTTAVHPGLDMENRIPKEMPDPPLPDQVTTVTKASLSLDDSSQGLKVFFGHMDPTSTTPEEQANLLGEESGKHYLEAITMGDKYDFGFIGPLICDTLARFKRHQAYIEPLVREGRLVIGIYLAREELIESAITGFSWNHPSTWPWKFASIIDRRVWHAMNQISTPQIAVRPNSDCTMVRSKETNLLRRSFRLLE